jgi:DNA-binding NarL/FixJ family response regulator
MPLDETIDYALASGEWTTGVHGSERSSSRPMQHVPRATPSAGPLTQREHEVAALVARGLTNRRIAEELMITEGTAASHVKHILARLTLASRVQIATWEIEHGLHRFAPRDLDAAS